MRMTLHNESIEITPAGVWIQPILSNRFRWGGSIADLIAVLVANPEIDLTHARFYVRETR